MTAEDEARKREGAAVDRTAGALGGLILGTLASATLGPAGITAAPALAATSAPWIEEMSFMARTAIARRSARAQHAVSIASETAGLGPDQLLRSLLNDDDLVELTARAIEAAAATTLTAKVAALGRSLGQAANDRTRFDVELLVIDALRELESSDIRLLAALDQRAPYPLDRPPAVRINSSGRTMTPPDDELWTTWTIELFEEHHPHFAGVTGILASRLASLGLITRQTRRFEGIEPMRITDFGRMILQRLRTEGLD